MCNCKKKPRQEPQVVTSTPEPVPTPKAVEEDKQEN